jgi:hypothetical protein
LLSEVPWGAASRLRVSLMLQERDGSARSEGRRERSRGEEGGRLRVVHGAVIIEDGRKSVSTTTRPVRKRKWEDAVAILHFFFLSLPCTSLFFLSSSAFLCLSLHPSLARRFPSARLSTTQKSLISCLYSVPLLLSPFLPPSPPAAYAVSTRRLRRSRQPERAMHPPAQLKVPRVGFVSD